MEKVFKVDYCNQFAAFFTKRSDLSGRLELGRSDRKSDNVNHHSNFHYVMWFCLRSQHVNAVCLRPATRDAVCLRPPISLPCFPKTNSMLFKEGT